MALQFVLGGSGSGKSEYVLNYAIKLATEDRKNNVTIEASLLVGRFNIILPFFIKAYTNGISLNDVSRLAKALGDLVLRDAIIGTRADLRTRLDDVFKKFDDSVDDIVDRVEMMKKTAPL